MAVHWSSELSKWEFRDLHATCMAIDWSGNNVLLAGKRLLAIKQLNYESENNDAIKRIVRQSKYDVAGAEWCQIQQGQRLCAISSNQKVDIFHWRNGDLTAIHSLKGHTRAISDTHWHREDHNVIATCSIDTFTHLWDLRDSRKPVLSLSAVAGASQVQWNKVTSHLLATAHDGDVKLWDKRKGTTPVQYISAHLCKIHGLDWSPHHDYQLVTSSHDGTIKFFDINNPRKVESTITANYPVWKAMYTPFGNGLVTMGVGWGGVPRDDQAGVVGIWVNGSLVYRLVGHTDIVLQMQWRPNTLHSNYQLITWARDQTLRLWMMQPSLLKICSHFVPDENDIEEDSLSESLSFVSTSDMNDLTMDSSDMKMVKLTTQEQPQTFASELDTVKTLDNVSLQDFNIDRKICIVRVEFNNHIAIVKASFSSSYPFDMVSPKFSWLSGTNLDTSSTFRLLQAINIAAYQKIRQHSLCLVHCLKVLSNHLKQIPINKKDDDSSMKTDRNTSSESGDYISNSVGDHCIPFPRTCGAKWCGVGMLVVFNRPPNAKRMSLKSESSTPRSLSSLSTPILITGNRQMSPHSTTSPSPTNLNMSYLHHRPSHSITMFYFQDRWKSGTRRSGSGMRNNAMSQFSPRVLIYKADQLFHLNKNLAEKYIINDNISKMCKYNASVALSSGRQDLIQAWRLTSIISGFLDQKKTDAKCDNQINWAIHPFGINLIQTLINHYAKCADVQMAAMLCCTLNTLYDTHLVSSKSSNFSTNSNTSGSVPNISEVIADGWAIPVAKLDNPNSWSDSTELNPSYYESPVQVMTKSQENSRSLSSPLLDAPIVHVHQCHMRMYAEILHRWNLLNARAEVMKRVVSGEETKHVGLEIVSECQKCKKITREGYCLKCSVSALNCVICNIGVRGSANACLVCGHGGHTKHMIEWFTKSEYCPSGCGCRCLRELMNMLER